MTDTAVAVFSEAADGDLRADQSARTRLSLRLGVPDQWATVDQVHGADVLDVSDPGVHGAADGMFTTEVDLPLAVFTADCAGVILIGPGAIGVAHAGWRGVAAGVVPALRDRFDSAGREVDRAIIGPHIRSCCFEVGSDVTGRLPHHAESTTWGTPSVDLAGALREQLTGIEVQDFSACTRHEPGWFSHRRDGDARRLAALVVRRPHG